MKYRKLLFVFCLMSSLMATNLAAQTKVLLDVPFFSQYDSRWKSNSLGGGPLTIGSDGCAITSVSMVLAYYGLNPTPATFNDWLTSPSNKGYNSDYRLYWGKIGQYSGNVVRAESKRKEEFRNQIRSEIDSGRPMIAETIKPEHWIVISGYSLDVQGNISYYVNDPLQSIRHTTLTLELADVYLPVSASVPGKGFIGTQITIGQFPPWGIAGRNQTEIQPKFKAMADEILTAYRPIHPSISIEPYSNNPNKTDDGKYVHEWVKNGDRLVAQDILIKNAGLIHERAMLVLAGDGSRAYAVKEGFYWLFILHNTGVPLGNEQLSQTGVGQVYQRFDRAMAYWDNTNKVLTLKDYAQQVIAQYTSAALTIAIAGAGGDDTYALGTPTPAPDPVIPLTNLAVKIMPADVGNRWQLNRGQERADFVLSAAHDGGNKPLVYSFYVSDKLATRGPDPFCSITLTPGIYVIRARVEAGSGNNLQAQEVSQSFTVESAPKSDCGVPFEAKINTIALDGTYAYAAGVYGSGPNAGKGFLRCINRSNPAEGQSYTFSFVFNEIVPRGSYLFAATTNGLMVSRDQGASWSTVFSNGQAYDIAILPGDLWNDWPIKIIVGCSGGTPVYYGNWIPAEPDHLTDVRSIGGFGPYTLEGGRRGNREWVFILGSGPNGVNAQIAPWHMAYTNFGGRLNDAYAGRAWTIYISNAEVFTALQRNAGDNVYYSEYYGSGWEKVRGIPSGDDVVAFTWINSLSGITRKGALYHAPANPTQWRAIAGFSGELNLDLAAGQFVTCMKRVGPDVLIGTERGLRVIPVARIAILAAAKPVIAASEEPAPADTTALLGNYPNPFNPETTIKYALAASGPIELRIYNLQGQVVRTLVSAYQAAGRYAIRWDGKDAAGRPIASGVYIYRLEAGSYQESRKLILLK